MKVCVVGGKGNMGKRYRAILKHLEVEHISVDINEHLPTVKDDVTHYIIATPTDEHLGSLMNISWGLKPPVNFLIEKPIAILSNRDVDTKLRPVSTAISRGHNVYMVNQYAYCHFDLHQENQPTYYDYYNSGKDGLAWDCIQIIYLAKDSIDLKNDSPEWTCFINGLLFTRNILDRCYIRMIEDFISDGKKYGKLWGWDDIRSAHRKAFEYTNRSAGT